MNAGRLVFLGDSCVSLIIGDEHAIDRVTNARCVFIATWLEELNCPGIRDVVPAFNAVTVHYDMTLIDREEVAEHLRGLARTDVPVAETRSEPVEIPTVYGGEFGPDLDSVARFAGCSADEVARLHSDRVYDVYMMGFLPGFAYMGVVDSRIAMPRHDTPRPRVIAGSVGIAGEQTGIYPVDSPGGWQILGRTSVQVFDPVGPEPFLLKAGDRVKFIRA